MKIKESKAHLRKENQDEEFAESRKHFSIMTKEPQIRLLGQVTLGLAKPSFSPGSSLMLSEISRPHLPQIRSRNSMP